MQLRRYCWIVQTLQDYDRHPTGSSASLQPRLQDQMLAVKATLCNFIFTLKQQRQNHVGGSEFVTDRTVSLSLVSAL